MAFEGWEPTCWPWHSEARNAIQVLKIMINNNNTRIRRAIVTEEPGENEGKMRSPGNVYC